MPKQYIRVKIRCNLFIGLSFLLGAFTAQAGGTKTGPKKHQIKFTVIGLHDTKCFLGCHYGDKDYVQDTAIVDSKGNFEFSGEKELEGGIYFVMIPSKKYFEFIVDKEQKFSITVDTTDFIKSMKVTGSEENEEFYKYLNFVTFIHDKISKVQEDAKTVAEKEAAKHQEDTLNEEVRKFKLDFIKRHPEMFLSKVFNASEIPIVPPAPKLANGRTDSTFAFKYYKVHFFDGVDFSEGRLVRSPVLYPRIKEYLTRLTVQNPDSVIAAADYLVMRARASKEMFKFIVAYITSTYESSNIMGMDAVFVHMAKQYYTADQATWVSASQLEKIKERAIQLDPILIGKKAPSIVLPDTSNVMQAMDSIKARFTVVYFWDYDCGHCQKETPLLIKWYDSIKGEGIEVYAVQTNENSIAKWKDYIKLHKLDWMNISDIFHTSNFRHEYDVVTTPMIYILDENKKIIAKKLDVDELNKVIKHFLEKGSGK